MISVQLFRNMGLQTRGVGYLDVSWKDRITNLDLRNGHDYEGTKLSEHSMM